MRCERNFAKSIPATSRSKRTVCATPGSGKSRWAATRNGAPSSKRICSGDDSEINMMKTQKYTVHLYHLDYRMASLSMYAQNEHKLLVKARRQARFLRQGEKRPTHIKINDGFRIDVAERCYTY